MLSKKYRLFCAKQTGSLIPELAFALCGPVGERMSLSDVDYSDVASGRSLALLRVNPLGRLPTLVLPSGEVLTESGAIILHLGEAFPRAKLVPLPRSRDRIRFFRLLFVITGELYPCFTFGDDPSEWIRTRTAHEAYGEAIDQHRKKLWIYIESILAPRGPWALGRTFSAIDLFLTVMSRWHPGEKWVHIHCPRVKGISDQVKAMPALKATLRRNGILK